VKVKTLPVRDAAGKVIGAAEVFTDGGEQSRIEERLRELEQLALIDPLTGVGNRRFLEMTLTSRAEELRRYGWPFGVLLIDLDKFKRINDRYGHDVGDQALKMVASTLTSCSRASDAVGRWGGDEFMVVLANANETGMKVASERVRTLVERSALTTGRGPVHATVSIGGALAGPEASSVEQLLQVADRHMYCAKSRGRNCASVQAA
jgi:diguanylate cyclase (GGDEF)-like protein